MADRKPVQRPRRPVYLTGSAPRQRGQIRRPHAASACALLVLLASLGLAISRPARAQNPTPTQTTEPAAPVANSDLDDRLMYQLLVAEMALAQGDTRRVKSTAP